MFEFNRDVEKRDKLIFGEYAPEKYMGGTRQFEGASVELMRQLLDLGYMDPEETQNDSPTAQEFVEYAEKWGGYVFDGYVVSINRQDYRVDITAISKGDYAEREEVTEFIKLFRFADEFDVDGGLYAWFD